MLSEWYESVKVSDDEQKEKIRILIIIFQRYKFSGCLFLFAKEFAVYDQDNVPFGS